MIIAELSIVPIGDDVSVSKYVKVFLEELNNSNLKYEVGAMCTTVEAKNLEELFDVVEKAHEKVMDMGVNRAITSIKIDDRRDKETSIASKIEAVR